MIMSASTLISDCCQAVIYFEKSEYCCSKCMKLCQSGGTLGDLARADTRQRAERAASLIWTYMTFNGQGRSGAEVQAQIADIIAAEFEK